MIASCIAFKRQNFSDRFLNENWNLFIWKVGDLIDAVTLIGTIISNGQSPWYTLLLKRFSNNKKRLFRSAKLSGIQHRLNAYSFAASAYKIPVKVPLKRKKKIFCLSSLVGARVSRNFTRKIYFYSNIDGVQFIFNSAHNAHDVTEWSCTISTSTR